MLKRDPFLERILGRPACSVTLPDPLDFLHGTPGFAFAKVPCDRVADCALLEDAGFRLVDTAVQLSLPLPEVVPSPPAPPADCLIRIAQPQDREGVADVARRSFRYSRFHLDPRVPGSAADEIKRQWAENYFLGKRGEAMVVAVAAGKVAGFLLLLRDPSALVVDLIAVAPEQQRRGLGCGMIRYAVGACADGRKTLLVGTQAANIPSLRAYEKLGFRIRATSHVFHYHGNIPCPE